MWWINLGFLYLPEEMNFLILEYYDIWNIENEECQNEKLEDWYREDCGSKTKLVSAKMAISLVQVASLFTTLSPKEFGHVICHISKNKFGRQKQIFVQWNQHQGESEFENYPFKSLQNSLSFTMWILNKKKKFLLHIVNMTIQDLKK